eukprot:m.45863 g.45863  ORF g.45863 m.45863 type:complete len:94 (-) comp6699_c0_seq2:27-308(-)
MHSSTMYHAFFAMVACLFLFVHGHLMTLHTSPATPNSKTKTATRYGGVHLGPDRFKHFNNCARSLLETSGLVEQSTTSSSGGKKTRSKGKRPG